MVQWLRGRYEGDSGMSYIVPGDRPKTCGECSFSSYEPKYKSLRCMLDDNRLYVERDTRYAYCKLIDIDKGALFNKENAKQYLGANMQSGCQTVREVTE